MREAGATVVLVPIGNLKPAPWNPRTIRDERFRNLCRSLEADPEFLWRRPILAMGDGTIYAGNMRYRAAAHLGLDAVPAVVEDIPAALAKERALRDNAQWGEWERDELAALIDELRIEGADVELLGFDERELAALLPSGVPAGADADAVPEPPAEPATKRGDLWLLGDHRVLCGDSTSAPDVGRLLGGERVACAVYDPEWDKARAVELPGDRLVFTDGGRAGEALAAHGPPRWVFVWDCVSSWYVPGQPLRRMKLALWYGGHPYDGDGSHYGEPGEEREVTNSRGTYRYVPDARGKHLSDCYQRAITAEHAEGPSHAKPVDWVRMLIANTMPPGIVHDPFLGSGTTLIACEQLGRRCYGMEIEPRYVDVIVRRWEAFTGRAAELDGGG